MRRFSIFLIAGFLFIYCKKNGGDGSSAVGNSSGAAAYQTSAQIGAAGGTINDPNGQWTFTVPAGALSETKTITVTTNATPVGSVPQEFATSASLLKLEPSGLTFLTPATLKVTYPQGEMSEGGVEEKSQKQYYINDDSTVTAMATTLNTTTNEITAQVPHFTITGTLKTNITRVNSGSITRPSRVRRIANNLITYFNNLGSDAARNAEFQLAANNPMLLAFLNKLVQILGSDIFTAAFPNADFDGDGTVNSADPIVAVNGANVTLVSSGSLFVSTNPGAINSTQFVWRSSATGTYSIRLNGTNCSDGTQLASGAVTQNVDNTYTPINASALIDGDNEFRVCVTTTPGPITRFLMVEIARDEVLPVSSASPAGGTYSTAQNVSMSCLDTGAAECAQIAYTTNGTDPTFDAAGNVTNGTLVTGMWMTSTTSATTLKVRSRDDAGNIGLSITYNFIVPTYSVVYDGNGSNTGSPPIDANSYVNGNNATVLANTANLSKTNFVFSGWNTQADGLGSHYPPGTVATINSANITLYANWRPLVYRFWGGITGSGDGEKLAASVVSGEIYTSSDSGLTWVARQSARPWGGMAAAATGSVLAAPAINDKIYISLDWGITWTAQEANRNWKCVSSSADGAKLLAAVSLEQLFISNDSGTTWTARESNRAWHATTSSADGSKLGAVVYMGQIYTSTDSGANWTPRSTNRNWVAITSSADGVKLAAAVGGAMGGLIYTSSDSGVTWISRASSRSWISIASSGDGTRLAAAESGGLIYTSNDSGVTWTAQDVGRQWVQITMSNDGSKLAAAVNNGMIFTSSDFGVNWIPRY